MNNNNTNYRKMYSSAKIEEYNLIKEQEFKINIGHSYFNEIKKAFFQFFDVHELYKNIIISIELISPYMVVKIFKKGNNEFKFFDDDNSFFYYISDDIRKLKSSEIISPFVASNSTNSTYRQEFQGSSEIYHTKNYIIEKMKAGLALKEQELIAKQKYIEEKESTISSIEEKFKKMNEVNTQYFSEKINELNNKLSIFLKEPKKVVKSSKQISKPRRSLRLTNKTNSN
jgi:hypothetical protein